MLALFTAQADSPENPPPRFPSELQINAGFGFSSYENKPKATSAGFYGEVDYVLRVTEWFYPKAYAGLLLTGAHESSCSGVTPCDVSNRIGFGGLKGRFMAPFDYVRPYVEAGGGLSVGTITTHVADVYEDPSRHVFGHVALGAGLALGPHQEVDIGFSFLLHPSRDQSAGGITVGVRIPL